MIIIFHFQYQFNALLWPPPPVTYVSHLLGPRTATMMGVREAPKSLHWSSTAAVVGATLTGLVHPTRSLDLDSGNPYTRHFALQRDAAWRVRKENHHNIHISAWTNCHRCCHVTKSPKQLSLQLEEDRDDKSGRGAGLGFAVH